MKKRILILSMILLVGITRAEDPGLLIAGPPGNWGRNIAVINRYLAEPLGLSTNWKAVRVRTVQWQATTNARVKLNVSFFKLGKFTRGTSTVNQVYLDRVLSILPVPKDMILAVTNNMNPVIDKGFGEPPVPE